MNSRCWLKPVTDVLLQCRRLFSGGLMIVALTLPGFALPILAVAMAGPKIPPVFVMRLNGAHRGRLFQGIGGLSAGASSRLLYDYPKKERSAILDYLFKPHFGAGYQILKVEIGGDVDSTDGAEPSFARTPHEFNHPDAACFNRGYEWWLMRAAQKRNPQIQLWALQWGAPYWVGHNTLFTEKNARYVCQFIKGAWKYHHLRIDYCGLWNERIYSVPYITLLRKTLDAAGLQRVKIVAADDGGNDAWSIADHMLKDPALMNAVYAIGAHYPLTWGPINMHAAANALKTGRPLWASEDFSKSGSWKHAKFMAHEFIANHLIFHTSSETIWPLIGSWYPALPCGGQGPMLARTPWSGHYRVRPALWALAHFAQFVPVGWTYLGGSGCGKLPAGGDFCGFRSAKTGNYTIVAETAAASASQRIVVHLSGGLSPAPVYIWESTRTRQMVMIRRILPLHHAFACTLKPHAIYSITTTRGQMKGRAFDPPRQPFALPFVSRFGHGRIGRSPKYFSDQHGAFAIARDPSDGRLCLLQSITHPGVGWMPGRGIPLSLIGSRRWRNYQVSVHVRLPQHSFASLLGRVEAAGWHAHVHGYRLNLHASGRWTLWSGAEVAAHGNANLSAAPWHVMMLDFSGLTTTAFIDGHKVASHISVIRRMGMAGIGCNWNHVEFRDFSVTPVAGAAADIADLARHAEISASSSWSKKYSAGMAVDGNSATRWNSAPGTSSGQWLEIQFPRPEQCNVVLIRQFGGRIMTCRVQWSENGKKWRTLARAAPDGKPRFQIKFAGKKVTYLRLLVNSTAGNQPPSIYQLNLFNCPPSR